MRQIGESDVNTDAAATTEDYPCIVYGVRNLCNINEARLHLFRKLYAPKNKTDLLEKIKASDSCCLPSCQSSSSKTVKNKLCCVCLEKCQRRRTCSTSIWTRWTWVTSVKGKTGYGLVYEDRPKRSCQNCR